MISFFKKRQDIKLLVTQFDRMFLLLMNTEIMQLNKMNNQEVVESLLKTDFVFTIAVLRHIKDKKIDQTKIIKCTNFSNKEMSISSYVKHFKDKSFQIADNLNFDKNKIDEIFNQRSYFLELARKYESGELDFI